MIFVLSVSFLVAVISSSPWLFYVVFESLYRCVNAVFNADKSSSYFFSCHRHLWDILALCMVISFLILWSICLSFSQVRFKNDPRYLMMRTAQVFIPLIRFLLYSFFFLRSPLVPLRYSFLISFFHLNLFDGVMSQDAQVFVGFLFYFSIFS